MSLPRTREQLKQWCLRKLGAPVVKVNVSDQQLEDRIDEAIDYFQNYNINGVEETYLKHKITASTLTFDAAPTTAFVNNEVLTGGTSGALGLCHDMSSTTECRYIGVSGSVPFEEGELVTGEFGGTATIATDGVTIGDVDNGYFDVSEAVISVSEVLTSQAVTLNMFDLRYQFALQRMSDVKSMDLITYTMAQTHFQFLEDLFNPRVPVDFNRHQNRIYLRENWRTKAIPDSYLAVRAYRVLDPTTIPQIYGDLWLRLWTTMLFKEQWATNMAKFDNIELPGGVKLNVSQMKSEVEAERTELEKRLRSEFTEPCDFFVG